MNIIIGLKIFTIQEKFVNDWLICVSFVVVDHRELKLDSVMTIDAVKVTVQWKVTSGLKVKALKTWCFFRHWKKIYYIFSNMRCLGLISRFFELVNCINIAKRFNFMDAINSK